MFFFLIALILDNFIWHEIKLIRMTGKYEQIEIAEQRKAIKLMNSFLKQ